MSHPYFYGAHIDVADAFELAQRNRLERDRLIAQDAVRNAKRLNVRVIEVDGTYAAVALYAGTSSRSERGEGEESRQYREDPGARTT